MKPRLDISASELMEMRAQGMSNHDIAKSLDISMTAVYKRIGKQGGRMERMAAFADDWKPGERLTPSEPPVRYEPELLRADYRIADSITASIDSGAEDVLIRCGEGEILINSADIPALTQFLVWVSQNQKGGEQP